MNAPRPNGQQQGQGLDLHVTGAYELFREKIWVSFHADGIVVYSTYARYGAREIRHLDHSDKVNLPTDFQECRHVSFKGRVALPSVIRKFDDGEFSVIIDARRLKA